MKKTIITILVVLFTCSNASSQILTRYYQHNRISEKQELLMKGKEVKILPEIDIAKEIAHYDSINPARFGVGIDVNYTLNDGEWFETDSGKVWTMTFVSQNAKSLNFVIKNLSLSEKSEMYITNGDHTIVYGPVNCNNAPDNGTLISDVISGNTARIVLYEANEQTERSSLSITKVVRGFRDIQSNNEINTTRSDIYNSHIACNPDWEPYSNGIALIMSSTADSYYTGYLVMSTDFSFVPYMLTDSKLMDLNNDKILSDLEKEKANQYTFKFLSKRKTCNNETLASSYTYSGSTFRAHYGEGVNQFLLLQLNNDNIKYNSEIHWLGWDRGNGTPTSFANIFHDDSNLLKLSTDYNSYVNLLGANNNGWRFYWELNHYIGNKDGSPLFNQNKRVVGQRLWGGESFVPIGSSLLYRKCALFNRFGNFWIGGGTNSSRLSNWLDPIGTNQTIMDCKNYNDLQIGGQTTICGSEIYRINNLPVGYTVNWTYANYDSTPQNIVTENTPQQNECTVCLAEGQKINGTLTAIIKRNGQIVATRTKTIYNMFFFGGAYSQEAGSTTPQINVQTFSGIPNIPLIYQDAIATIMSGALQNKIVTYSGDSPSYWEYNPSGGYVKVKFPMSNSSQSIMIRAHYCPVKVD